MPLVMFSLQYNFREGDRNTSKRGGGNSQGK